MGLEDIFCLLKRHGLRKFAAGTYMFTVSSVLLWLGVLPPVQYAQVVVAIAAGMFGGNAAEYAFNRGSNDLKHNCQYDQTKGP